MEAIVPERGLYFIFLTPATLFSSVLSSHTVINEPGLGVNKTLVAHTHTQSGRRSPAKAAQTEGSMATSQLISFYASLTAPLAQLWEINGTGSISRRSHSSPVACAVAVNTHTHTQS